MAILILITSSGAEVAQAQKAGGGSGTRGGGQGVPVAGGTVRLRDLVDGPSCRWLLGDSFSAKLPLYKRRVLDVLEPADWLFALQLKARERSLKVCMSRYPLPLLPEDQEGTTVYIRPASRTTYIQVAIRQDDEVYIDDAEFKKMDETSQAMLWLHEILHDYYPAYKKDRMPKLREFVATVEERAGAPFSERELRLLLEVYDIEPTQMNRPYPIDFESLSSARAELEAVGSDALPSWLRHLAHGSFYAKYKAPHFMPVQLRWLGDALNKIQEEKIDFVRKSGGWDVHPIERISGRILAEKGNPYPQFVEIVHEYRAFLASRKKAADEFASKVRWSRYEFAPRIIYYDYPRNWVHEVTVSCSLGLETHRRELHDPMNAFIRSDAEIRAKFERFLEAKKRELPQDALYQGTMGVFVDGWVLPNIEKRACTDSTCYSPGVEQNYPVRCR